mmetsp:Transcript_6488/g.11259  ORF Transcript_6488/g.11259 Transcript_6488/m.11259 type:complete len:719 (+) Transcript_6488:1677-3833(+)
MKLQTRLDEYKGKLPKHEISAQEIKHQKWMHEKYERYKQLREESNNREVTRTREVVERTAERDLPSIEGDIEEASALMDLQNGLNGISSSSDTFNAAFAEAETSTRSMTEILNDEATLDGASSALMGFEEGMAVGGAAEEGGAAITEASTLGSRIAGCVSKAAAVVVVAGGIALVVAIVWGKLNLNTSSIPPIFVHGAVVNESPVSHLQNCALFKPSTREWATQGYGVYGGDSPFVQGSNLRPVQQAGGFLVNGDTAVPGTVLSAYHVKVYSYFNAGSGVFGGVVCDTKKPDGEKTKAGFMASSYIATYVDMETGSRTGQRTWCSIGSGSAARRSSFSKGYGEGKVECHSQGGAAAMPHCHRIPYSQDEFWKHSDSHKALTFADERELNAEQGHHGTCKTTVQPRTNRLPSASPDSYWGWTTSSFVAKFKTDSAGSEPPYLPWSEFVESLDNLKKPAPRAQLNESCVDVLCSGNNVCLSTGPDVIYSRCSYNGFPCKCFPRRVADTNPKQKLGESCVSRTDCSSENIRGVDCVYVSESRFTKECVPGKPCTCMSSVTIGQLNKEAANLQTDSPTPSPTTKPTIKYCTPNTEKRPAKAPRSFGVCHGQNYDHDCCSHDEDGTELACLRSDEHKDEGNSTSGQVCGRDMSDGHACRCFPARKRTHSKAFEVCRTTEDCEKLDTGLLLCGYTNQFGNFKTCSHGTSSDKPCKCALTIGSLE